MSSFAQAVQTQTVRTTNGMKAHAGTSDACVDLFYKIGALRNGDPIPPFTAAFAENPDLALRILQWGRDVRGGAGEREVFRKILKSLEKTNPSAVTLIIPKIPEIGRFDDLFIFTNPELKAQAFTLYGEYLRNGNALAAKWAPREKSAKSKLAKEFREFFGMSPRQYRKTLVGLTNVVETQMCANDFKNINFSHVPSVASARYKKAFQKHAPAEYADYANKLASGDTTVKINASAIFPHDVLKNVLVHAGVQTQTPQTLQVIKAQWEALPDYVGDSPALAIVDVSGSMSCSAGGSSTTCHQIALSLGLYLADKNRGPFKDTFLTFSSNPQLMHLKGDIIQKLQQMNSSNWDMSTDVIKAFKKILDVAIEGSVKNADMPKTLFIFSDMQFNQCARYDETAFNAMKRMFTEAGYDIPNVVFWNLNASNNVPVKSDSSGAALVSGFSPAVMTAILSNSDEFTPRAMMEKAVMVPRYDLV